MCRIGAMNKLAADELKNNKLLKVFLAVTSVCVIGFPLMAACAFEDDVSHDYGVFLGATSADIDVMKEYETVVIDAQYYTADEIDELDLQFPGLLFDIATRPHQFLDQLRLKLNVVDGVRRL